MRSIFPRAALAATLIAAIAGTLVIATPSRAQQVPDAGNLLRETRRPVAPPEPASRPAPAERASPLRADDGVRFTVRNFRVLGASLVPEHELQDVLAPWLNRPIGFADLNRAGAALSEAYRRRGWLARVQWPAQDVTGGTVTARLIEGRFGAARVDTGGRSLRVDPDVLVRTVTAHQQPDEPTSLSALERATNLLGDLPGVLATVSLAPGSALGLTDVVIGAQDKPAAGGLVQLDNFSSRSTGIARLSGSVRLDSPSGRADQAQLTGQVTAGTTYARLDYSLPVGVDGLRVGADVSGLRYHLVGDFAALEAKGTATTAGVYGSYPVLRSARRNLMANWTADLKRYRNEASGAETSDKRAEVLALAFNGDAEDDVGAGGFVLWGANAALGRLTLDGDAANQQVDASGPHTAGGYFKLALNAARLQRLDAAWSVWISGSGQWASKNLDSAEKLSLGGPNGVRAYALLEGQGDEGWQASAELRRTLAPGWQATAFIDAGGLRIDRDHNYTGASGPNQYTLKGAGIGVGWSRPGAVAARVMVAHRIGSDPVDASANGGYRAWASLVKFFN